MIRVSCWTPAALTALLLLFAILIGGTRFIQAEPAAEEKPAVEPPSQSAVPAKEQSADEEEPSAISSLRDALKKVLGDTKPKFAEGDDEGHELYRQMIDAMRQADSLSYVSHYTWESNGRTLGDCTYRVWLEKPNYFRVEAESDVKNQGGILSWLKNCFGDKTEPASEKRGGILIGDGDTLWIYWPGGRPQWGEESEADRKTRLSSYMKKPAPLARHSIGHEVVHLGAGMCMPIIDPSTFHGYTDSLQQYLDGVKSLGVEKVGDEEYDKIEVSIMKHQRSWFLWLSKTDHLPRKLQEIVRVSHDIIINEEWTSVTLNAQLPDAQFAWKPPEGWSQWTMPKPEERLLKPGAKAPDFDLVSADDTKIKLSDYRGKVVWFYIWRAG